MKTRFTSILTSAALAAGLAASAFPVSASYQSADEIAFALRGIETEGCGYLVQDNLVYVAPSAAAAGTSVHIGMFIEAEYADLAILNAEIVSDSPMVTFDPTTYHNPTALYSTEKMTYVTEAGVEFSTRLRPYCFGKINSAGVYQSNSFGVNENFNEENTSFNVMWMHSYTDNLLSAEFFGSRSDEYSFIELDVNIAAGTQPGEYNLLFASDITEEEPFGQSFVTSDDSTEEKDIYTEMIPTLKDLKIIVPPSDYLATEYPSAYRWLDDATALSGADFFTEDAVMYVGSANGFTAQKLDPSLLDSAVFGLNIQYLTDPENFVCGNMFEMQYNGSRFCTLDYWTDDYLFADVFSGVRGDINEDSTVNAADAAEILVYAAERGAGKENTLSRRTYFLADVNEGSTTCGENDGTALDAKDAGAILQYAAVSGTGVTPDWTEIVG